MKLYKEAYGSNLTQKQDNKKSYNKGKNGNKKPYNKNDYKGKNNNRKGNNSYSYKKAEANTKKPAKKTLWQRIKGFFGA